MNEIDEEKRSLKIALTRIAQDPQYSMAGTGRDRQNKERRLKERQRYLIEDRAVVQQRIGRLNREVKKMNRVKPDLARAFYAVAEEMLDEEQFIELELRAAQIISST